MSNYSNGRPFYPPSSHPSQSPQGQYDPYSSQPAYPDRPLQRTASFDENDDAPYFDNGRGQTQGGVTRSQSTYAGTSNPGSLHGQGASGIQHNIPTHRASVYTAPLGGYQHQAQALPPSVTQSSYDPSRFPRQTTQPQFTPQVYNAPTISHNVGAHQPYNPAAYQASDLQRQPSLSYGVTGYYNATGSYGVSQAPPPPPRPGDLAYNPQTASFGNYQHEAQYQPPYGSYRSDPLSPQSHTSPYSPTPPNPPVHDPYAAPQPYSHSTGYSQPDTRNNATLHALVPEQPGSSSYGAIERRPSSFESHMSNRSSTQGQSPRPSLPSPPSRQHSQALPHRTETLNRHPQARPLPGPPSESESDKDYFPGQNGQDESGFEDIMKEVDAAISQGRLSSGIPRRTPEMNRHDPNVPNQENTNRDSLFSSGTSQPLLSPDEVPTHINGNVASSGDTNINYGAFSDESDAEAAAGVAAMMEAERLEAEENSRRRSGSASLFSGSGSQGQSRQPTSSAQDLSSDSDYHNVDMASFGGGYGGQLHYGDEPSSLYTPAASMPPANYYNRLNPPLGSTRSSARSSDERESQLSGYESIPGDDSIHPFPQSRHTDIARVDTGGTGGLTEPSPHPRRLSYEDGDEVTLVDSEMGRTSGSASPYKDSMQDPFYYGPGINPQRPLPPAPSASDPGSRLPYLIPAGMYGLTTRHSMYDSAERPYPSAPDSYQQTLLSPAGDVPRSISLSSTRSAPKPDQPIRSKTDVDRARLMKQQMQGRPVSEYDSVPQSAVTLDLPTIPRKKFNPSKLSTEQYKRCAEPWALSSIVAWIKDLAEDEVDLRVHAIAEALVALFTHKVPTMNTADAETLGDRVVKEMFAAEALVKDEEWVKFGPGTMTGVLFQLTGTGCYSLRVHDRQLKGRCYSHHCMRTLKKVDLSLPIESEKASEDWATFYNMKKEDLANHSKKEIERQNVLHEIVTSEVRYISNLDILRVLYRDTLVAYQPPIIQSKKLPAFIAEVFGNVDALKKVNEDYLLAQLKYRQIEKGPWIVGFSDIFREWIRKAKSVYLEYAAGFPHANYLVRREAERNLLFKQFLDQAREDKRSNRLSWDTYLKDPITRLQRYGLLLQTTHKTMEKDSEEKLNLQFAIDEIRAATFECNGKVAEMQKKMDLLELSHKIRLRKGMEKEVELNLDHLGREVLIRGDLQRAGGKGFQWVDMHAILFDHYLVLAKTVTTRDSAGARKYEIYDVSKVPIPMDLIVLESTNDDPVVKSSLKGVGAVTSTVAARGQMTADQRLARTTSTMSGGPGILTHTATSTSLSSKDTVGSKTMVTTTVLESSAKDEKIMFPFRVKHLGKTEVYTLYAPSAQNRQDWCEAITEAKTRHAASLYVQNAEPFRLRVLADTAFGYEGAASVNRSIVIKATPLDRAIKEAESKYEGQARPGPVCRAAVNCATVFNQPYGRLMCAIGTDFGVYISEYENPRGWTRAIQMNRVTQIAVFEELNVFLLIADKALIAYHLDVVCPIPGTGVPQNNDTSIRKAPQKLSGAKDVGFFATGRMKDRALVFYKKREGLSSTFKVLEPVLQKSITTRSRFQLSSARRGQIEFFRDFDEFYIPAECYTINLFHSSLAISTSRGVEVLTLDKKQPWTVPNLRSEQADTQAHLSSIASRIKDLKPLGMFRLGEAEFLVAFEECAVYVNKHGDVSRGVVMEFVGRAKSACLYGQYLILFDDDFVEIRNAMNGRMKQVIAGKDIKMLDDGGGGNSATTSTPVGLGGGINGLGMQGFGAAQRTVKLCMQHPDYDKSHVVVELVENEGQKE